MIDHVSLSVTDLARATGFYEKILTPLGHKLLVTRERTTGFGKDYPELWLNLRDAGVSTDGAHVALRARDRQAVDGFHDAALANGGVCGGAPGERPVTTGKCYAAFIIDPFGNRVEVVTFDKK